MAGTFRDYIPEGEDPGALGQGFHDFVPPKTPVKQEVVTTPEDEIRAKRIAALEKAREAKKAKQTA